MMKWTMYTASFAVCAVRASDGARLSENGLYLIQGFGWLIAAEMNFNSVIALRLADFEGLPSTNIRRTLKARTLHNVRVNHEEGRRNERPRIFLKRRAANGEHLQMLRQVTALSALV